MRSRHLKFTDAALYDLVSIRQYTEAKFGLSQADRYDRLLRQALEDIKEDPNRPGSKALAGLGDRFRVFRIDLSARRSGTGVRDSRHVVVYAELSEEFVGISRILHDSMVLDRHIPESHRTGIEAYFVDDEEE